MTTRELKKLKYNGKLQKIKVIENLYVYVQKESIVFKFVVKKEGKKIEATINSVDNITLTQAKQIVQKLKTQITDKDFAGAREIIRSALAKKQSKKDKEVIIKKQRESERYLLKNIIQEFLQTRNRQSQISYGINNNPLIYLTLKNIEKTIGEKYQVKHFKATTNLTDIQELYKTICELKTDVDVDKNGHKTTSVYTKYALMFLMLAALRNGTLRRLEWNMINWDKKIIEIPGEITKTKKDFRLPLTNDMLKILEELKKYDNGKGLIFKGRNNNVMSENTLNAKIKKLSNNKTTAHGIRTAFSTILKEKGANPLYVEEQLAHIVENKVGQAYTRTDYLEQRRKLLEKWSELVTEKTKEKPDGVIVFDFKS